ncbi:MAG: hypothetical protein ACKVXR_11060 [Planctomycetota bacterium]
MTRSRLRALEPAIRRGLLLVVVYGTAAVIALLLSRRMNDLDYGWHLRTGEWIVAHRAFPDLELFSENLAGERWVAYSWAYDVLLHALRERFDLHAQVVLSVVMSLGIAHALFTLVRRISGRVVLAAALTGMGIVAMGPMLYGRSTMCTILFALLLLHCLLRANVLGQRKALLFVPLLFVAWANVHVQFLYGFFLYACFLAQALLDARAGASDLRPLAERRRLAAWMAAVGAASLAATLVNPYGLRIYEPLLLYLRQAPVIYQHIHELRPQSVDSICLWMTIGITLLVVLGAARRMTRRPFLLVMFACAAWVGFRSARDAWFIAATGSSVAAIAFARRQEPEELLAHPALIAAGTLGVVLTAAASLDVSQESLAANQRRNFPVDAASFIESRQLPGPMFNHYNWGGYLMWRLPQWKVSTDGRSWVHSTEHFLRSQGIWRAEPGWQEDPELSAAGFVVAARKLPLTVALSADPRFRLAYEDEVAAVYVRNAH